MTSTARPACVLCQAPVRQLWPPRFGQWSRDFRLAGNGEWKSLLQCPRCGALWFEIPEEPYGAFPYWIAWPFTIADWQKLNSGDDQRVLDQWHAARLRALYPTLDEDDKQAIEHHRQRAYGRAPLALSPFCPDRLQGPVPDVAALLREDAG